MFVLLDPPLLPKPEPSEPEPYFTDPPAHVLAAHHFIELCNEYTMPRYTQFGTRGPLEDQAEYDVKVHQATLDPFQEETFGDACRLLSRYFNQNQLWPREEISEED